MNYYIQINDLLDDMVDDINYIKKKTFLRMSFDVNCVAGEGFEPPTFRL